MTKGKRVERKCAVCGQSQMITPKGGYVAKTCQKCTQRASTFNGRRM